MEIHCSQDLVGDKYAWQYDMEMLGIQVKNII